MENGIAEKNVFKVKTKLYHDYGFVIENFEKKHFICVI
jgi:hypothetical protein